MTAMPLPRVEPSKTPELLENSATAGRHLFGHETKPRTEIAAF
jgi:hypothetical protein